ncbi:MAG: TolC family protein [Desulfitobacterium sp.]
MKEKKLKIVAMVLAASLLFTTNSILADSSSATGEQSSGIVEPTMGSETVGEIEEDSVSEENNATLRLSLEDALKAIETGNTTLQLTDSKILIYDFQYQQALARHNTLPSIVDEDSARERKLNHLRTLWTLENAKYDREELLKDLKIQVTKQYQDILALQEQVKKLKAQLGNVDTYIEQLNLQIELGMAIQSQVYSLNAQKSSLEAALKSTENNINSSMIALKRDLGIDLKRKVILTSELIAYTKFDDTKFEEQMAQAIANDYDIQRYEEDIKLTDIEYDIALTFDNPGADQLQVSVEDKKATLEALPVNKEVALRTAYNNLKSLENSLAAAELSVEADRINIDILQKKIDVGISSSIEMIELQNQLLNDQYTLLQSTNNYMTAAASLRNSLNITD